MRPSETRSPRESTTTQLNLTLILSAAAHAAASAFWASAYVGPGTGAGAAAAGAAGGAPRPCWACAESMLPATMSAAAVQKHELRLVISPPRSDLRRGGR